MTLQPSMLAVGTSARVARRATRALLLVTTLASPIQSQQPAHAIYYAVPSWAPDRRTIAFESNRDGDAAIYTIRPDGSHLTRLTPVGIVGEQANWSAQGRHMVFSLDRNGVRQLYLMKPDGSELAVPNTTDGFLASFSPDGRWILFAVQHVRPSMMYRVVVMHPDGSSRRQLGDSTKSNEDPRWTVDGQRVVFTQVPVLERRENEAPRDFIPRRNKAQQLLSVAPESSETRMRAPELLGQVTRDRGLSPDGKWMVFSRTVDGVTGLSLQEQPSGPERLLDGGPRQP